MNSISKKISDFLFRRNEDKKKKRIKGAILKAIEIAKKEQHAELEKNNSVIILPPCPPGSTGDEAMLKATITELKNANISNIALVSYDRNLKWELDTSINETIEMGDFLFEDDPSLLNAFAKKCRGYQSFYLLGADTLDGHYTINRTRNRLALIEIAAALGLKSKVLGFSFNRNPHPEAIEIFSQLPENIELCARDIIAKQRLDKITRIPVQQVADLAFLIKPSETYSIDLLVQQIEQVKQRKENGATVIGVNLNSLTTDSIDDLIDLYRDCLGKYIAKYPNTLLVFVSHDTRGIAGDHELATRAAENLPQDNYLIVPEHASASEIKSLAQYLDFSLTGRMHFAIACLGQGAPPIAISYQGKFEGLYEMFGIEDILIEPPLNPEKIFQKLDQCLNEHIALRKQITTELPRITNLSRMNFDHNA